jgi:hypothetical protein
MKALKINTTVNLLTGETIATGSIVKVCRFRLNQEQATLTSIPCQVTTKVYKSKNSMDNGKRDITEIQDFSPHFALDFPMTEYESTGNFENKIINLVKVELEKIYPTFVEIVNI